MGRMPNAKRKRAPTLTVQKKPHGKPDAQCIAHCTNGRRCNGRIEPQKRGQPMPYCRKHLRAGDGALKVYQHPKGYGKILVARFNLAKGYRMVYHGHRKTTGTHHDDELDPDEDRTLWFYPDGQGRVNGYIDPTGCPGSVLQFAANCGPKEVVNLRQSNRAFGARDGDYGGMEYTATMAVPAGTQLVHNYGASWWKDRPELKRCDVGTDRFPAPKRKAK
ncbi:unnamed protein product [Effrenium voratum]|uniref:SET domain-containing protein n=1 Tax=Effrenium voratum TaxID=2562239 RepID=A0AA36I786_9DINO|nr:unnamed protein product [Effrenium voratum]